MARIRVPLNNFVFGEISPSLTSRVDSAIYNQSGQSVKNVFIRAEGGVINRPGTKRLHNFSQSYSQPSATVTVTDYANIAVGTQLSFILDDGTKIILEFETSSADAPSTNIGNKYFVRAFTDNNTTADNIFTALNAISGLTSSNPASNVVTVTRDGTSITNLKVTTSDSTRLAVTDFSVTTQKIRLEPGSAVKWSSEVCHGATRAEESGTLRITFNFRTILKKHLYMSQPNIIKFVEDFNNDVDIYNFLNF